MNIWRRGNDIGGSGLGMLVYGILYASASWGQDDGGGDGGGLPGVWGKSCWNWRRGA